jgi:hypothetical protein
MSSLYRNWLQAKSSRFAKNIPFRFSEWERFGVPVVNTLVWILQLPREAAGAATQGACICTGFPISVMVPGAITR